ncbi:hypothetical protein [Hyalangium versicolor]|uniref:hypothetical protein n=1 Tax=Hyalangium versicolor TaxID=2861190 RepID=UPI001CCE91B3|nr:hypothetical protein [Hyalangium versicolor]
MPRLLPLALLVVLSTALLGSDCGDAEAVPLEELRADIAPPFDYSLYCDAQGTLVGRKSAVLLVHRTAHLEQVYAASLAGDERAHRLFTQLEDTLRRSGTELADEALGVKCSTAPACALQWQFLDELIPSREPGGIRLRELLAASFSREAKLKGVRNAAVDAVLNVLLAGTVLKQGLAETRAGVTETRQLAQEISVEERLAVSGVEGRMAEREVAEALAAHLAEAEAQEIGARCPARIEVLARYRPSRGQPPTGIEANNPRWRDYVAYWERRYEELTGQRSLATGRTALKPPLTWDSYEALLGRFQSALQFQRNVSRALRHEAQQAPNQRVWLRGLERPIIAENVGLAHEGRAIPTYVDQLVVDEATLSPGQRPSVHSFSDKQHDFSSMNIDEARAKLQIDITEAHAKYGGAVEVRRPSHPLFEKKVIVSRVHLVYDGKGLSAQMCKELTAEAALRGVELHFHVP